MDKRFIQANKEAKIALILTLSYLIVWSLAAYFLDNRRGFFGFPMWFEASCFFLPLTFIVVCWVVVKFKFSDIPLDSQKNN